MASSMAMAGEVREAYDALQREAIRLAGEPEDIAQRAAILYDIYLDSRGNHRFPLIVLHGALWADRFLRHTATLIALLRLRYRHNARRRAYTIGMVCQFVESLKSINRQVFIDTYVLYYITKRFGRYAATLDVFEDGFAEALAAMHEATGAASGLSDAAQRDLYLRCLHHEQETMVAPRVERAVAEFACPLLRRLCVRPVVHFAYFPRWKCFPFQCFSHKPERVRNAIAAYDLAERCGWVEVLRSVADYGVLPTAFFDDPCSFVDRLQARLRVGEVFRALDARVAC